VVLAGASNLKYSAACFRHENMTFVDLSASGWMASAESIGELQELVKKQVHDASKHLFLICSETHLSVSSSLMAHSPHHTKAEVTSILAERLIAVLLRFSLKKTIDTIMPIFKATQNTPCVIIPPLPRYLFARCCDDTSHCTNSG
jgi:hypothetical protein